MKDFNPTFFNQVELLLTILPYIADEKCFAVKGGTAINLFVRDMPRLSVDIDLAYLPFQERENDLLQIEQALTRIKQSLLSVYSDIHIRERRMHKEQFLIKLFVVRDNAQIVIEPNTILRGTVLPCQKRDLVKKAEKLFQMSVSDIPILSIADLYAGKICAALDRQHPRDLFDIKVLFEHEGITEEIRQVFVCYLASSRRPMHELLEPNLKDFRGLFASEFTGMTDMTVTYDELHAVRDRLIGEIKQALTSKERDFLISIKLGEPDWSLMEFAHLNRLPALQWKLQNVKKTGEQKQKNELNQLRAVLEL